MKHFACLWKKSAGCFSVFRSLGKLMIWSKPVLLGPNRFVLGPGGRRLPRRAKSWPTTLWEGPWSILLRILVGPNLTKSIFRFRETVFQVAESRRFFEVPVFRYRLRNKRFFFTGMILPRWIGGICGSTPTLFSLGP